MATTGTIKPPEGYTLEESERKPSEGFALDRPTSRIRAPKGFTLESPAVPTPEPDDGVGFLDYPKAVAAGVGPLVSGAGFAARKLGAERAGTALEDIGRQTGEYWRKQLSPAAREELAKEIVTTDERGVPTGIGEAGLSTVGLTAAMSAPAMAAMLVPGAGLARLGRLLKLSPTVSGALGFGAAEGVTTGVMSASESGHEVRQLDHETLLKSPVYNQKIAEGLSPDQAREELATSVENEVFAKTAPTTGILGAGPGAVFGRLGRAGGGRAISAAKGAGVEFAQEVPQSASERYFQNVATRKFVDPEQGVYEGVANEGILGGLTALPLGGGAGAVLHTAPDAEPRPKGKYEQAGEIGEAVRAEEAEIARAAIAVIEQRTGEVLDVGQEVMPSEQPLSKIRAAQQARAKTKETGISHRVIPFPNVEGKFAAVPDQPVAEPVVEAPIQEELAIAPEVAPTEPTIGVQEEIIPEDVVTPEVQPTPEIIEAAPEVVPAPEAEPALPAEVAEVAEPIEEPVITPEPIPEEIQIEQEEAEVRQVQEEQAAQIAREGEEAVEAVPVPAEAEEDVIAPEEVAEPPITPEVEAIREKRITYEPEGKKFVPTLTKRLKDDLQVAKEEIAGGRGKYFTFAPGESEEKIWHESTNPPYYDPMSFKEQTGYARMNVVNIIDRALKGMSLTDKQRSAFEQIVNAQRDVLLEQAKHARGETVEKPAWDLKEGDKFNIKGEEFEVKDTGDPDAFVPQVTLEDGEILTVEGDETIAYDRGTFEKGESKPKPEVEPEIQIAEPGTVDVTAKEPQTTMFRGGRELPKTAKVAKELKEGEAPLFELAAEREAEERQAKIPTEVEGVLPPRTSETMADAIAMTSPEGKISKRAKKAATERLSRKLFGEEGLPAPTVLQPGRKENLLRQAKELRELADRGMKPKAHLKKAIELEKEAEGIKEPEIRESRAPIFYSKMSKFLETKLPETVGAGQASSLVSSWAKKGEFKEAELEWSGLQEWLKSQTGKLKKQDIVDYLKANEVVIDEVEKGEVSTLATATWKNVTNTISAKVKEDISIQLIAPDVNISEIHQEPTTENLVVETDDGEFILADKTLAVMDASTKYKSLRDFLAAADRELLPEQPTKYGQYTLPGGQNYRELLLRLPPTDATKIARRAELAEIDRQRPLTEPEQKEFDSLRAFAGGEGTFTTAHFAEANILAHVRMNDRTDADGKKVLFIEEMQSDWAAKGRREGYIVTDEKLLRAKQMGEKNNPYWEVRTHDGRPVHNIFGKQFKTEESAIKEAVRITRATGRSSQTGVPDMPFKGAKWQELTLKRMLRYAAENGYDKLAWISGQQTADRYDLSKKVDKISYWETKEKGKYNFNVFDRDRRPVISEDGITLKRIEELVGKDIAQKVRDDVGKPQKADPRFKNLSGEDLKVSPAWATTLYDKMIPQFLSKYGKKWGVRVEPVDIEVRHIDDPVKYVGPTLTESDVAELAKKQYRYSAINNQLQNVTDAMNRGRSFKSAIEKFGSKMSAEAVGGKLMQPVSSKAFQSIPITPDMKQSVLETGQPLFARPSDLYSETTYTAKPVRGLSESALNKTVEGFFRQYKGAGDIDIKVVASAKDLPYDASDRVEGATVVDSVYLVADNMKSVRRAREVLLHEVVGHLGFEKMMGSAFDPILKDVERAKSAEMQVAAVDYGLDLTKPEDIRVAAQEVIARMSETDPDSGLYRRAVARIKKWLKENGFDITFTDADFKALLASTALRIKKAEPTRAKKEYAADILARHPDLDMKTYLDRQIALESQKPEPINTPAFKEWFGKSKVTDRAGRAQIVYHGSPDVRGLFKSGVFKTLQRDDMFFATDSFAVANTYADDVRAFDYQAAEPHVVPLYLSLQNPQIIDAEGRTWTHTKEAISRAKDAGHDGVIIKNSKDRYLNNMGDDTATVYVFFESNQAKSAITGNLASRVDKNAIAGATGNIGTFDPAKADIRESRTKGTPEQEAAISVSMDVQSDKPLRHKVRDWLGGIADIDKTAIKQGILDEFASVKEIERETFGETLDASESPTAAARRTKNLSSTMAAVLMKGPLQYNESGGVFEIKPKSEGFYDIFHDISENGTLHLWKGWAMANRAKRLMAEGREHNMTQKQIDALLPLEKQYPEFRTALDKWRDFNKGILDMAEQSGVIDKEDRAVWDKDDYVPFFRVSEDITVGPRGKRGLASQKAGIRTLKGGEEKVADIIENMVLNVMHLTDASFKNVATQKIVDMVGDDPSVMTPMPLGWKPAKFTDEQLVSALKRHNYEVEGMSSKDRTQMSTLFQRMAPQGKDIVSVLVDGKSQYYQVHDKLLLRSLTSLGPSSVDGIMKLFRGSKRLLTSLITVDPSFMARNFMRDTLHTWVISKSKLVPGLGAVKGMRKSWQEDESLLAIMAAGGGSGGFYRTAPEDVRSMLDSKLKSVDRKTLLDSPKKLWEFWQKVGAASENANRIAVYDATIAEGGTKAEAVNQAQDLLNFTQRGDYAAIQFITETVPFWNARLQGLYKLGRSGYENPKSFALKGMMLGAATLALHAVNKDNPEYEELPEWEKDVYYHFWIDGEHYRMPKPFEVGAIFSTIPERMMEVWRAGDDKLFIERMEHMILDTFNFRPVPQLISPVIEQYANRKFFFDMPIVPQRMERLLPEAQYGDTTPALMRKLADLMPDDAPAFMRSPKRLEALWNGYLGTMGRYLLDASNANMVREAMGYPTKPELRIDEIPVVSSFVRAKPARSTKYTTAFYDMLHEANQIYATIRQYQREGRYEDAKELMGRERQKLLTRKPLNDINKRVRAIRKEIKQLRDSDVSPKIKRKREDVLILMRNHLTKMADRYREAF